MTNTDGYIRALTILRSHPDWSDELVASAAGIHLADIDATVKHARTVMVVCSKLTGLSGPDAVRTASAHRAARARRPSS
jgi:hypothetical protein